MTTGPRRPPKPCAAPGCGALVQGRDRYCPRHLSREADREASRHRHQQYNRYRRDESDRFYGTGRWRKLRDAHIARHPLCQIHQEMGMVVEGVIVDHILPRKERPDLELDPANLRTLCRQCHNRHGQKVTRTHRGG